MHTTANASKAAIQRTLTHIRRWSTAISAACSAVGGPPPA
jgi:hypothetical protein